MDLPDAIHSRKSIRSFKPDNVPKELINSILETSQRAPSGTNTQPWHVYVCTGAIKQSITTDVINLVRSGQGRPYKDFDYYPASWNDIHQARRRCVGWTLYDLLGIERNDRAARDRQSLRNFQFFDAPVGLFITVDAYLGRGSWLDAGMYVQTLMLAAKIAGLDTCPQAAWLPYQEPILRHLEIPEDQVLVTGMSMGYANMDAIENTLVSERETLENVVHYKGFD